MLLKLLNWNIANGVSFKRFEAKINKNLSMVNWQNVLKPSQYYVSHSIKLIHNIKINMNGTFAPIKVTGSSRKHRIRRIYHENVVTSAENFQAVT